MEDRVLDDRSAQHARKFVAPLGGKPGAIGFLCGKADTPFYVSPARASAASCSLYAPLGPPLGPLGPAPGRAAGQNDNAGRPRTRRYPHRDREAERDATKTQASHPAGVGASDANDTSLDPLHLILGDVAAIVDAKALSHLISACSGPGGPGRGSRRGVRTDACVALQGEAAGPKWRG